MIHVLIAGAQAAEIVSAMVGEPVEVTLEEASTAGYMWQATEGGSGATVTDAGVTPGDAVGAASLHKFTLKATRRGQITVHFRLRRPWEQSVPPAREVSVTIDAR